MIVRTSAGSVDNIGNVELMPRTNNPTNEVDLSPSTVHWNINLVKHLFFLLYHTFMLCLLIFEPSMVSNVSESALILEMQDEINRLKQENESHKQQLLNVKAIPLGSDWVHYNFR